MSRLERFRSLRDHMIIGSVFRILSAADVESCEKYIMAREHLNDQEFAAQVNQFMVDVPREQRPPEKKLSAMWALLSQSVPVVRRKRR